MLQNSLLNLQFAQHVSVTFMPIIRSLGLYRCSQHVAHNLGYGWGMFLENNIPQSGRITYSHKPHLQPTITNVMCHMLWISVLSQAPDDGHKGARNLLSEL